MFLTGLLYLIFERSILGQKRSSDPNSAVSSCGSRTIMGAQVWKPSSMPITLDSPLLRTTSSQTFHVFHFVTNSIQVGMILLALIVTRSSVASLQAKQGLPLGNQVLGWAILGECCLVFSSLNLFHLVAQSLIG